MSEQTTLPNINQRVSLDPYPDLTISQVALGGVGLASQHFYGGSRHSMNVANTGEHQLVVTDPEFGAGDGSEVVGSGIDREAALRDSLMRMRSLETVHTKALVHIEMAESSSVSFTSLAHYNPRMAPGSKAHPIPDHLEGLLTDNVRGDSTYVNTTSREGWQTEVRSILEGYLESDAAGRELVSSLKIASLDHLTPEQAVKLSTAFVQNVSKYSYGDLQAKGPTRADNANTPELLQEGINLKDDPHWEGNGVCRNIAANVKAVFEALKHTQSELSMLNNTYAVFGGGVEGAGYADKRQDGYSLSLEPSGHAWNTFVTIDSKGSAVATITDATWALGHDVTSAMEHLDRTEIRAVAQIAQLYERSERKADAFWGVSQYIDRLLRVTAVNTALTPKERDGLREYSTTEYLKAASQLEQIPEGYGISSALMGAVYRMRGKLEHREVATLFSLVKAGGLLEQERLKAVISGYDKDRDVRLPEWKSAENLVFSDNELQELAYEAIGADRVGRLAEESGAFRMRLRQQHPDALPPFDPHVRRADGKELSHIASQSGIQDRDPGAIMRRMKLSIKSLAGDPAVYEAIIAGRSDYDLALNYQTITSVLHGRRVALK